MPYDFVFIVRVKWKGRISFSLDLIYMEKFDASLTVKSKHTIESKRRRVIDPGEKRLFILAQPDTRNEDTRIAMETWSLNALWIFVWIESYESSFEPIDRGNLVRV